MGLLLRLLVLPASGRSTHRHNDLHGQKLRNAELEHRRLSMLVKTIMIETGHARGTWTLRKDNPASRFGDVTWSSLDGRAGRRRPKWSIWPR